VSASPNTHNCTSRGEAVSLLIILPQDSSVIDVRDRSAARPQSRVQARSFSRVHGSGTVDSLTPRLFHSARMPAAAGEVDETCEWQLYGTACVLLITPSGPFLGRVGFGCSTPSVSASAFCSHQSPPPSYATKRSGIPIRDKGQTNSS